MAISGTIVRSRIPGLAGVVLLALASVSFCATGEQIGTECLYEFNKAYSWNESAKEQLNLAQQHAAEFNVQAAREHYQQAVALLQKSITQYEQLPELAFDCSPTNLSIARNNIRIAQENLRFALDSMAGLDCLKALDELDSLTNLASEYYYEHHDPTSARQSADDAVALASSIAEQGICNGDYRRTLAEQTRYARKVADSLGQRTQYQRCMQLLEQTRRAFDQANRIGPGATVQRRQAWRQALERAGETVDSRSCEDPHLENALDLLRRAREQLSRLNTSE